MLNVLQYYDIRNCLSDVLYIYLFYGSKAVKFTLRFKSLQHRSNKADKFACRWDCGLLVLSYFALVVWATFGNVKQIMLLS